MTFPNNLFSQVNPSATSYCDDPSTYLDVEISNLNNELSATQIKLGINGSLDTTTIEYLLKNSMAINPGHKHTTASINFGIDENFVTASQLTIINNISGINTGDQDLSGYELLSHKGVTSGYASLDSSGKIPTSQLPDTILGALNYHGTHDASGGTNPSAPAGGYNKGDYWVISVAGMISSVAYSVGDWIVYNGSTFDLVDNSDKVSSVNGAIGTVVLNQDNILDGITYKQYSATEKTKLSGIATSANVGVVPNGAITGATKTKITYDAKGLVTSGVDVTPDDLDDTSTTHKFTSAAEITKLAGISASAAANADLTGTAETVGGTAVVGVATTSARSDHKHAITKPAIDTLAAATDITTLNASTTAHGLVVKATAPAAGLINIVGIANAETVYTNKALFDATVPSTQAFGDAAAVGSATVAARRDHKHAMMAAPTTITGNAGTATKLAATKNINGVAFDGSANITVPSDIVPGTSGNLLTSNGTVWTSAAAPVSVSVTTKGDIQTYSTTPTRLPVGVTNGHVLKVNSATATGLEWGAGGGSSPLTTKGDLYSFSTVDAKLPVGTNGQVLSSSSADTTGLKWVDPIGTNGIKTPVQLTGTVDGTNKIFNYPETIIPNSQTVYLNGVFQDVTANYTISGTTVTFVDAPTIGSYVSGGYQNVVSTTGNADTLDGQHAASFLPSSNNWLFNQVFS